ncbi:hypothetical protein [Sphingomonas desiccabilis]|uniref:Glycosyl transferase n=1 Tax=Sphingomonas desiccabilis TaxID=429134 RepID=A0A4Q2IZU9_9SPHN|nr:hypothetical protein [Sphingomonas desiccabilis]MBB3910229.1 hypothetical protein [Sphingomonas desiccabilis]RXZ34900.1 hypothetical protein EO081_04395 [Sphingomonas desiccabilis]
MRDRVAFLFLGETLLIPHLFPIVEALGDLAPDLPQDLWVSTSMHEALIGGWLAERPHAPIRIRRAPGFRTVAVDDGTNPPLPPKLPMLARLAPRLARVPVAVCAEQTSLWLPRLLPFLPTRFVKTSHGVGSMSARDDRRRRAAWHTLVPSERERRTYLQRGMPPERIVATGYVKAGFRQRSYAKPEFAEDRPVLLYNPHWQQHRSSWWQWGQQVVRRVLAEGRWNLIFAPHQRLVERAPEVRALCEELKGRGDTHCDYQSFAAVDGSYTAAADLYLGDTSSQLLEFLVRPRPCVFLNAGGAAWRQDPSYAMWVAGEVVDNLDGLLPALSRAGTEHPRFADAQAALASDSLGDTSGAAPARAASEILRVLAGRHAG